MPALALALSDVPSIWIRSYLHTGRDRVLVLD